MEAQPVNLGALDALVLDYVESEFLVENRDASTISSASSNVNVRMAIHLIQTLMQSGRIMEAFNLMQEYAPVVLEDQHLLFQLHKQWSEARRFELAATITSTLKAQLRVYDPLLSLTLRYLISIHNAYCLQQGVLSSIVDVTAKVVLKDRDPPAMPHEGLLEAPSFNESDVQALAQAAGLSRQGALNSLRFTNGDLFAAFKNELSRLRVNFSMINELVKEYCIYRGLIGSGFQGRANGNSSLSVAMGTQSLSSPSLQQALDQNMAGNIFISSKSSHGHPHGVIGMGKLHDEALRTQSLSQEASSSQTENVEVSDVCMEEPEANATEVDQGSIFHGGNIRRSADTCNFVVCGTSGSSCPYEINNVLKDNWTHKWQHGRPQPDTEAHENSTATVPSHRERSATRIDTTGPEDLVFAKYGKVLEVWHLADEGRIEEVIDEVNRLHPHFFEHSPQHLFRLKQVEFLKYVEDRNYCRALNIARVDLGPLAAKFPDLLQPLKETLLALAHPKGEPSLKLTPAGVQAAALHVALAESLGIVEPQLIAIMRTTLLSHTHWFKLQFCPDPFADLLCISRLKETEVISRTMLTSVVVPKPVTGGDLSCLTSGSQSVGVPSDVPLFEETSILILMEFLALSRGDAVQLLVQYDGSVENVFAHLIS
ncbi:hypothetical protein CY35_20G009800 [Sphagnum magellanicum]|nr:hypothetical protein CY35_20G009800 [Sphagnum magellanicum]KAH9530554.1 hypothetical protein CY35_20G009800 [Sphagnum magellanicum]